MSGAASEMTPLDENTATQNKPGDSPLARLLADQRQRWQAGERVQVERCLEREPSLQADPNAVLDLIYNEVILREQAGESPQLVEYLQRFPQLAAQLAVQFDLDRAFRSSSAPTRADHSSPALPHMPATFPAELPTVAGYEIVKELGRGGMGVVYQAWQPSLRRLVALKMVLAAEFAGPQALARLRVEAEAVARLQDPHIVQIHEVGEHDGRPYLVLEYADGDSLEKKLAGTPQPSRQAAQLVETLARAVHHAHARGILHRDLKPGNVLVMADGTPKITDFGLAKILIGGGVSPTHSGDILGTPSYMAPEQAAAGGPTELGPAADVYSLGAILYELMTGRPAFKGETPLDTLQQVLFQEPVAPRSLQPKVPRDLNTICLKCLHKNPRRRYASANALADDLHRFQSNQPIQARPVRVWERGLKWARRRPALAALGVVLVLVVAVGLPGVTWLWRRAEAARGVAAAEATAAARAKEEQETDLYFTHIALAERELSVANVGRAEELLETTPERRRGWEWHYLKRLRYGEPLRFYAPPGFVVGGIDFSHDGRRLATPLYPGFLRVLLKTGGVVKVWDTATDREYALLRGPTGPIAGVAYSSDGRYLVSGGWTWSDHRGEVVLWDLRTGAVRSPWPWRHPHTNTSVFDVTISNDGRWLAAACGDSSRGTGEVLIWDIATAQEVRSLPGPGSGFSSVRFSPDGRHLAAASWDGLVRIWDATTGDLDQTLAGHTDQVRKLAYSADGQRLASASVDRTIKVWDTKTGQVVLTLTGHLGPVMGVVFNADGTRLASASLDKTVKIWDLAMAREALTLRRHQEPVWNVAFSADGWRLASASLTDGVVWLWDATPLEESQLGIKTLRGHTGIASQVAFGGDGRYVASASWDQTIRLWDPATGQEVRKLEGHTGPVTGVAFRGDGQQLVSSGIDGKLRLWDAATGRETRLPLEHECSLHGAAFSADGRSVAAAGDNGTVTVWDVATGAQRCRPRMLSRIQSVAFSPDGRRLAATSIQGDIKVWETEMGGQLFSIPGTIRPVSAVAFSPDGQRLATVGWDKIVKLWDLKTEKLLTTLSGHGEWVLGVAFSRDGKRLASACGDCTVKVWDVEWDVPRGKEQRTLRGHLGPVYGVAFSPDGSRLAAASGYASKGEVKIWDLTRTDEDRGGTSAKSVR